MVALICPLCCGETFRSTIELKKHINGILGNLKCSKCLKIFNNIQELYDHMEYECDIDDKSIIVDVDELNPKEFSNGKENFVEIEDDEEAEEEEEEEQQEEEEGEEDNSIIINIQDGDEFDDNRKDDMNIENVGKYFCQVCGVNFDEVEEHLKEYHEGQEVIVEDDTDVQMANIEDPKETSTYFVQGDKNPKQTSSDNKDPYKLSGDPIKKSNTISESNVKDKAGNLYTRKFVKIDKFWLNSNNSKDTQTNQKEPIFLSYQYIVDGDEVKKLSADNDSDKSNVIKITQCPDCSLLFSDVEGFENHECNNATTKDNDCETLQCTECNLNFEDMDSLQKHLKEHEEKNENIKGEAYVCDICNTSFSMFKSLRLHRRMHDPIKVREVEAPVHYEENLESNVARPMFICKICHKTYDKQYETVHMESHNSTNNNFTCKVCNRKFFNQANLDMHMNAHTNNKKFSCSCCKKPFTTCDALKEHLSNQCQKRMYACQYCGRRFARPHEKVKHERIHTGEKPHTCEICGKSFRVSYCLTLHLRTHSGVRPYQCFTCGKRFKSHSVYNHHLLTHSEVRNYKCPYCPKAFKTSVQLAGHKNSHTKPFSCTECNRPFASLYAVRAHMETHKRDNNLKYECWLCGALYSRSFALRDHVRQQHAESEKERGSLNVEEIDATNSILVKEDEFILGLEDTQNIEIIEKI